MAEKTKISRLRSAARRVVDHGRSSRPRAGTPAIGDGGRLVERPVFILCATRSGSTLLRSLLNSHSMICAPHELHFSSLRVTIDKPHAAAAFAELGLTLNELETLLWDRLLFDLLASSGKQIIVDKTPQNAAAWATLHSAWPEARYIHLRRHPASMLASRLAAGANRSRDHELDLVLRYGRQLSAARAALPGPTVRYEDMTAAPERTMRAVCEYLEVPWEADLLTYAVPTESELKPGLGDWGSQIRGGHVRAGRAIPAQPDPELAGLIDEWGY